MTEAHRSENPRAVYNAGHDHTCSGWVVRLSCGEHIATFRREADADEYVRLVAAVEDTQVLEAVIARLRGALESLLPGLALDLRYADDDDDRDALLSRVRAVEEALIGTAHEAAALRPGPGPKVGKTSV